MTQSNHQKMNRAIVAGCVVLTAIVTVTPAWSRWVTSACVTSAGCEGPARIPVIVPSPIPSPKAFPTAPALQRLTTAPKDLGFDRTLFGLNNDRSALLKSIDRSLNYLRTDVADRAYANYPIAGVTRGRVLRSLRRFRVLVQTSKTSEQLQQRVIQEFDFYESSGKDGNGTVDFTGYFEPVYAASRMPNAMFRYPLYRQPSGFANWPKPHPTRAELEGNDGLSAQQGKLKGTELVWISSSGARFGEAVLDGWNDHGDRV
jgi:membrane-bound lytic murein transglycosylase A